ncbi:hypothetical protein RhiJN_07353 [Ceratobasidium sp. AG-Ba]|nr:hypothetical protein RhiJN_07353 [Ceratobasidium sp. AG-Ba]QRW08209.1 hypothetical protein RhiLY_07208 [Ceratobasidium sp. AG-Ba]
MEDDINLRVGRALTKLRKYEGEASREGRPFPSWRLLKQLLHIPTLGLLKPFKRTPPGERNISSPSIEENPGPPSVPTQPPLVETENQPTTRDIGVEASEQPPPLLSPPLLPSPPREPSISSDVTVVEAPQKLRDKPTNTPLPPAWTPPLQTVLTFHLYFLLFLIMQLAVLCFLYAFVFVISLIGLRFATT